MQSSQISQFFQKLQSFVEAKQLIKLTLTAKKVKSSDLKKVIISPVEIRKGYCLNFVFRHDTKDITKNYDILEGIQLIYKLLENDFYNAEVFSVSENLQLFILPNGKAKLKINQQTSLLTPVSLQHDKTKERLIQLQGNIYLVDP